MKQENKNNRHSRMSLSGIPATANKQGGDPRLQPSGMTENPKDEALNKNAFRAQLCFGFTLIELLVVVLIIGILAAIALPQYQKAVFKSRVAGALARVRAFDQAEAEFYLSQGYYAIRPEELALTPGASCVSNRAYCQWRITKGLKFEITIGGGLKKGNYYQWFCIASTGDRAAEDFCSKHGRYYMTNAGNKYYRLKSIYPTRTIYYGQTHFM